MLNWRLQPPGGDNVLLGERKTCFLGGEIQFFFKNATYVYIKLWEKVSISQLNEIWIHMQMLVSTSETGKTDFTLECWRQHEREGPEKRACVRVRRLRRCSPSPDVPLPPSFSCHCLSGGEKGSHFCSSSSQKTSVIFPTHIFIFHRCSSAASDFSFTAKALATKSNERS